MLSAPIPSAESSPCKNQQRRKSEDGGGQGETETEAQRFYSTQQQNSKATFPSSAGKQTMNIKDVQLAAINTKKGLCKPWLVLPSPSQAAPPGMSAAQSHHEPSPRAELLKIAPVNSLQGAAAPHGAEGRDVGNACSPHPGPADTGFTAGLDGWEREG